MKPDRKGMVPVSRASLTVVMDFVAWDPSLDFGSDDELSDALTHLQTAARLGDEPLCALCSEPHTARYVAPGYRDGPMVCGTHAEALEEGHWDVDRKSVV